MSLGDDGRLRDERFIDAQQSAIVREGAYQASEATSGVGIAPCPDRDVGHLVGRQVERRKRRLAREQPARGAVLIVVCVLSGQEDARIGEPHGQPSGR